jgi:hypothetical protein
MEAFAGLLLIFSDAVNTTWDLQAEVVFQLTHQDNEISTNLRPLLLGLILPFALDASITGLTAESWQSVDSRPNR